MSFDTALAFVIEMEGGYVNDPDDPGGETKFGISKRAYPHLDIAKLTLSAARAIYRRDYWERIHGDALPAATAVVVFDWAVQSGVVIASQALQSLVDARPDGVIGPRTIDAVRGHAFTVELDRNLATRLVIARGFYLVRWVKRALAARAKYLGGFTRRLVTLTSVAVGG